MKEQARFVSSLIETKTCIAISSYLWLQICWFYEL